MDPIEPRLHVWHRKHVTSVYYNGKYKHTGQRHSLRYGLGRCSHGPEYGAHDEHGHEDDEEVDEELRRFPSKSREEVKNDVKRDR